MYYDHFGEGVVNTFDRQGSLGLTMSLTNPSTITTPSCAVRFVSLTTIPTPFTSDQSFPSLSHQLSRASQRIEAILLLRLRIGRTPVARSHALQVIVHAIGKGCGNALDS